MTEKCFHWVGSHLPFLFLLVTNWCTPKKAVTSPAFRGESADNAGRKIVSALLFRKSVITVNCVSFPCTEFIRMAVNSGKPKFDVLDP